MKWLGSPFLWLAEKLARMGFWLRGKSAAATRGERTVAQWQPFRGALGGWADDRGALLARYRGWPFVAINWLATQYAGLQYQVALVRDPEVARERKAQGKHILSRALRLKTAPHGVSAHEELEPVGRQHPLLRLLRDPNGPDTGATFWERLVINQLVMGVGYLWAVPNQLGLPLEMWVLPSHWVFPRQYQDSTRLVDEYEVRPWTLRGASPTIIPADEVIELPDCTHPFLYNDGLSRLRGGAAWKDIEDSIDTSRVATFQNAVDPSFVFQLAKDMEDPNEDTINRFLARLEERNQGPHQKKKPMVLTPGMEIAEHQMTAEELAYVASDDQIRDKLLALYHVSKAVVGITAEVNRASMDAALYATARFSLRPLCRKNNARLTERLGRLWDDDLVIYQDDPVEDDPVQRATDLKLMVDAGVVSPNEVRAKLGMDPVDPAHEPEEGWADTPMGATSQKREDAQREDDQKHEQGLAAAKERPGGPGRAVGSKPGANGKAVGRLAPFFADKAGWQEGDHPRDDVGRFGEGGGGKPDREPSGKPRRPARPARPSADEAAGHFETASAEPTAENLATLADSLSRMTVKEIQAAKKKAGVRAGGNKAELTAKLLGEAKRRLTNRQKWEREARKAGVKPADLHGTAREVQRVAEEPVRLANQAVDLARAAYRDYNGRTLSRGAPAWRDGDHANVPRWDEIAAAVAGEVHEISGSMGEEEWAETLFHLVRAGPQRLPTAEDSYRIALDHLTQGSPASNGRHVPLTEIPD